MHCNLLNNCFVDIVKCFQLIVDTLLCLFVLFNVYVCIYYQSCSILFVDNLLLLLVLFSHFCRNCQTLSIVYCFCLINDGFYGYCQKLFICLLLVCCFFISMGTSRN